jgi:hypothetical protein
MTDDTYGGYRGMWRDAEDQLSEARAEIERLRIIEDDREPRPAEAGWLAGVFLVVGAGVSVTANLGVGLLVVVSGLILSAAIWGLMR